MDRFSYIVILSYKIYFELIRSLSFFEMFETLKICILVSVLVYIVIVTKKEKNVHFHS